MGTGSVLAQQVNLLEFDPRAARTGGVLFRAQCATCHGADGQGIDAIEAPDLTLLAMQDGITDGRVFQTIREGVPGSIMPPHDFPDLQIWTLVAYLKSIAAVGSAEPPGGNAQLGRELFLTNCASCHHAGDIGGRLGPDLSNISARRSQQALINSVRDPNATIGQRYHTVTLVLRGNQRIQGTIKNEDAFSIQVMDTGQQLRGCVKAELTEVIREPDSLMPSFSRSALSDEDIVDILSFLHAQL